MTVKPSNSISREKKTTLIDRFRNWAPHNTGPVELAGTTSSSSEDSSSRFRSVAIGRFIVDNATIDEEEYKEK